MKVPSFFRKNLLPLLALFAMTVFFAACKKNEGNNVRQPVAGLMAVNLIPEASQVGVAINGNPITQQPLRFNNFNGGYQSIFTGNRVIESFDFNTGNVLKETTQTFNDSSYYTVFVMGAKNEYSNVIVKDDLAELTPETDVAFVRFVNAIPDSSQSTVTITDNSGANAFQDLSKFKDVSSFKAVKAGDVHVSISNEGTINDDRSVTFESGNVYTVLLSGLPEATSDDYKVSIKFIANGSL